MDDVDNNHRATVVKEIAHINFTHLTWIMLSANQIESIEALSCVEMPHLLKLNLCSYDDDVGDNQITSMGVIRKAVWPKIQELIITENNFGDAKSLATCFFPKMLQLEVYSWWRVDNNTWTEQCFPAKMQAASLESLCIRGQKFCCDRSIKKVLQQKWSDVEIK